jgi:AcrR family transcriptional regulator
MVTGQAVHETKRRLPRAVRLAQVIEQARHLFATTGFHETSMDDLCRAVGVSKPVVYDLVRSKRDLLEQVLEQEVGILRERLMASYRSAIGPEARLRSGLVAFFRFVEERRDAWLTIYTAAQSVMPEAVARIRAEQAAWVGSLIREALGEAGLDVAPSEAEALGWALNGAAEHLAEWWLKNPRYSAEQMADLLVGMMGQPGRRPDPPRTAGAPQAQEEAKR